MNRAQEVQAIQAHVESQGVYQCRMGECFYGDEGPSYRERMTNSAKNGKRMRAPRFIKQCAECGASMSLTKYQMKQQYCSPECGRKGHGKKMSRKKEVACAECGKLHLRRPSLMRAADRMFCSQGCSNKNNASGAGKSIEVDGVTYKSIVAAGRALGITDNAMRYRLEMAGVIRRKNAKEVPCVQCGKVHLRRPGRDAKPGKMFCSASCANEHMANHCKNGKKTEYNGIVYDSLSAAARAAGMTIGKFRTVLKQTSGSRFA